MTVLPRLSAVTVLPEHQLLLTFSNGEQRSYDFRPNLTHPYYKPLQNEALFQSVSVSNGEIEWATGQDFCPHTLYEKSVPVELKSLA